MYIHIYMYIENGHGCNYFNRCSHNKHNAMWRRRLRFHILRAGISSLSYRYSVHNCRMRTRLHPVWVNLSLVDTPKPILINNLCSKMCSSCSDASLMNILLLFGAIFLHRPTVMCEYQLMNVCESGKYCSSLKFCAPHLYTRNYDFGIASSIYCRILMVMQYNTVPL